jgi:hypothetical protein
MSTKTQNDNTYHTSNVKDTISRSYPVAYFWVVSVLLCLSKLHFFFFTRAMLVFTVDFKDVTERTLARLFLQQVTAVQKQVAQSPHMEFRRSNEPPKEILDLGVQGSSSTCSEFLSSTRVITSVLIICINC